MAQNDRVRQFNGEKYGFKGFLTVIAPPIERSSPLKNDP